MAITDNRQDDDGISGQSGVFAISPSSFGFRAVDAGGSPSRASNRSYICIGY